MSEIERRRVWIHIHIIKCGGTTFNDILRRNHGRGFASTTTLLNDQYSGEQIGRILRKRPEITCLTGHRLSLDLPWSDPRLALQASTFIRDPVERFISHYFYHRHQLQMIPQAREMNLHDYTTWALEDRNQRGYINGQLRFLTGETTVAALNAVREFSSDGRLYLLPLSGFESALALLKARHPAEFRSCTIRQLNTSPRDQTASPSERERIAGFCDLDWQLYHASRAALDNCLEQTFSSPEAAKAAVTALLPGPPTVTDRIRLKLSDLLRRLAAAIQPGTDA